MHFIDFLLHLICFLCWALKSIYIFSFDYLIPVIGRILPVLTKLASQLISLLLRVFFTYISPCIIQLLTGTTYVFTKVIEIISVASMNIIDSDVNLEYAHAIIMVSLLVLIIYFHVTEKLFRFVQGWYQMGSLYIRFALNVLMMLRFCFNFIRKKVVAALFLSTHHAADKKSTLKSRKRHSTSSDNNINGYIQSINGSIHRPKDE